MRIAWQQDITPRDEDGGAIPSCDVAYQKHVGTLIGVSRGPLGRWYAAVLRDGATRTTEIPLDDIQFMP
jgi:hypothetical protein